MEIKTSYFAQLKKIYSMEGAVPIAICMYPPGWYKGVLYKELAPCYEMITGMKNIETREFYTAEYLTKVLGRLKTGSVEKDIADIVERSGGAFAVLLCFEKPSDFCHRHLVAEWLGRDPAAAELVF
ncbi:MAG: DUF488 domain-containing protein [Lachnospiraceae bacterium]|nr:DUF488 domain-containing protein [Lachnospiraceae bacterium]